mgnify:CR=1 FL=1
MTDRFSYFTFACFQSSFDDIVRAIENGRGVENGKYKLTLRPFDFDLYENEPSSGGVHLAKSYFFKPKTNDGICVMFSNYADGWLTLANVLSIKLQCGVYLFRMTAPNVLNYAMNGFYYINSGRQIRTVYAMQDHRWVFYEDAEIQWFEDESHYKMRMIKMRMNKEILVSYCERLGFDISNPLFWGSTRSILYEEVPYNETDR